MPVREKDKGAITCSKARAEVRPKHWREGREGRKKKKDGKSSAISCARTTKRASIDVMDLVKTGPEDVVH